MTERQTFEFNPASLQELADVVECEVECDLAFIRKRNAELVQQQVVFLDALNKLTIGRQEQSRKILELRAEIDTLTAQVKESHEQGYDVICSKDEEITELKKERAKCQEELEDLKWSMGLLRYRGMRFPVLEPVPDTFELRIKMILNEIREMKEHLAISKMHHWCKDVRVLTPQEKKNKKQRALDCYSRSRPVKEYREDGFDFRDAIKKLAEECVGIEFEK
jgi:chromosome segregation ATPase